MITLAVAPVGWHIVSTEICTITRHPRRYSARFAPTVLQCFVCDAMSVLVMCWSCFFNSLLLQLYYDTIIPTVQTACRTSSFSPSLSTIRRTTTTTTVVPTTVVVVPLFLFSCDGECHDMTEARSLACVASRSLERHVFLWFEKNHCTSMLFIVH